jgi:hypothetical protein
MLGDTALERAGEAGMSQDFSWRALRQKFDLYQRLLAQTVWGED